MTKNLTIANKDLRCVRVKSQNPISVNQQSNHLLPTDYLGRM